MADCNKDWRVVGLDLSDKSARYCLLESSGEAMSEGKVALTANRITQLLQDRGRLLVILEVGTHSPWVSRLANSLGHEVLTANPRQLALIYKNRKKNDRADAERLARLGRADPKLLCPIQHRGLEAQVELSRIRARENLVRARAALVCHVKGAVKSLGARVGSYGTQCFDQKALADLPEELLPALLPVLEIIGELSQKISDFDRAIEQSCEINHPETKLLQQVRGVGPLTALAFVLTLEEVDRFKKSRQVPAYLGLTPRQSESGETSPQLGISKTGDCYLRKLLVSCAHYIMGPFGTDCDLRRWGEKLAARGGKNAKKRAVVAVARRLAVLLHALWRSGEVYEPLRLASRAVA